MKRKLITSKGASEREVNREESGNNERWKVKRRRCVPVRVVLVDVSKNAAASVGGRRRGSGGGREEAAGRDRAGDCWRGDPLHLHVWRWCV